MKGGKSEVSIGWGFIFDLLDKEMVEAVVDIDGCRTAVGVVHLLIVVDDASGRVTLGHLLDFLRKTD